MKCAAGRVGEGDRIGGALLISFSTRPGGRLDCSSLDVVLRQPFDFAVTRIDKPAVARRLEKAGVPFAVFDEACLSQGRSVGWIRLDLSKAVPELVERCREAGVRKVLQVSFQREGLNAIPALRQAGIEADLMLVRPTRGYFKLEAVERGAMDALLSRLDDGRNWLPRPRSGLLPGAFVSLPYPVIICTICTLRREVSCDML